MLDVTGAREDAFLEAQEYEDYYSMVPVELEAPAYITERTPGSGETAGASLDTLREQVELGNLIWHTVHGEPR